MRNRSMVAEAARIFQLAALCAVIATPAAAYVGPGTGLGVLAAIFGGIAAFFMMIAGLIWYPFKAMLRKRREKNAATSGNDSAKPTDAGE